MPKKKSKISLLDDATQELVNWAIRVQSEAQSEFEAAQELVTKLGAHDKASYTELGFWVPELIDEDISPNKVFLEVFTPLETIDFRKNIQEVLFRRDRLQLAQVGDFLWGAVEGMQLGSRDQVGAFYWVVYENIDGIQRTIPDYLAYSLPFGAFAPAELYDIEKMQRSRADLDHFVHLDFDPKYEQDGIGRVGPPINILQIHVTTASKEGTLEGLTQIYKRIAEKISNHEKLTPAEENYIGYEAIQLMPIAPTIEYEAGPRFWEFASNSSSDSEIHVTLRSPDMTNWGYDILLSAMSAVNPVVLGSKRPDELVDFMATLHNFPNKPIKVLFDIVYGHIDNQSLPLLNKHFFAGANMYGQNVNFLNVVVRALLLEMQRRKHNFGVDGIRVDGAQDFKNWDPETDTLWHDDDYLSSMNDVVQEVGGQSYRPWMIFEDGRPWPRDDWELASSYRELTKQFPNIWQWGPLTFAHNTPFLFTFWLMKWWRIREMAEVGSKWITGCANHDTLRRGTQVPINSRINTYLGDSLPEIFRKAYDNPAAKLFDYAFMPGIPMDFINASMHSPWGFIRNTDDRYSVKVVSEESRFLYWVMDEKHFELASTFPRLKEMGFTDLNELRRFMQMLDHLVHATDYNLETIVSLLQVVEPKFPAYPFSVDKLKRISRAWMDDVHEYCNVSRYEKELDPKHTYYNLSVREFRIAHPWLMADLGINDFFDYLHPTKGAVLFFGIRQAPTEQEEILFIANMEGEPCTFVPLDLPIPNLPIKRWKLALKTPNTEVQNIDQPITLHDSQGVIFIRT